MTLPEACTLIVDLTCQLRDEKALRTSLEADATTYRELVTLLLTELHDWQIDPARQQRRYEQLARERKALLAAALRTEAA